MRLAETLGCMAALAGAAAWAAPSLSTPSVTQDATTRRVTVTYRLGGEPAVVTAEFLTNGAPVAAEDCAYVGGDVNRLVTTLDSDLSFGWTPPAGRFPDVTSLGVRLSAWSVDAPPDYMDVCLSISNCVRYYACREAVPGGVTNDLYKTDHVLLRKIPAKNVVWKMGSPDNEVGRTALYEQQHKVKLTNDYYLAVFPTTQRQLRVMGRSGAAAGPNDSTFVGDEYPGNDDLKPADRISLENLRGYYSTTWTGWPSNRHEVAAGTVIDYARKNTGVAFDLPTEAQWEYACRAGTGTAFNSGKNMSGPYSTAELNEIGWFAGNSTTNGVAQPHEVGLKKPNAWGLYDMHGNMFEWVLDRVTDDQRTFDQNTVYVEPEGRGIEAEKFIIRGGSYDRASAATCRSAYLVTTWINYKGYCGFRLWCPAKAER